MKKNIFRRVISFMTTATLVIGVTIPKIFVDAASEAYRTEISEDFESITAEDLSAGKGDIVSSFTNNPNLEIKTLTGRSGKYLSINATATDSIMLTKTGLLTKYDKTVVDMSLKSTLPTATAYATVTLHSGANNKQELLRYTASGIRNMMATETEYFPYTQYNWEQVRMIFDKTSSTVTVMLLGKTCKLSDGTTSVVSCSKTLPWEITDKAHLRFQTVGTDNTLYVDNIHISDGFYLENDYLNNDFENIINMNANGAVVGLTRSKITTQGVYDDVSKNTYLSLKNQDTTSDPILYTGGIKSESGKPIIVDFKLKAALDSNFTVGIRTDTGSSYVGILNVTNGAANAYSISGKSRNIGDGEFHTCRFVITPTETSYKASVLVDNVWMGTPVIGNSFATGARLDIRLATGQEQTIGLDDLHIYYPQSPTLRTNIANKASNVPITSSIILTANNPLNYSSFGSSYKGNLTLKANGEDVTIQSAIATSKANTLEVIPVGGLEPNTTYTLTGANTIKDMYDQYFSDYDGVNLTFTTESLELVVANLSYTIDGVAVGENKFGAGEFGLKLDVTSNTSKGANVFAVAAQYNQDGDLIQAIPITSLIEGKGTDTKTEKMTITETANTTIKLFTWDNNMSPLCDIIKLDPIANETTE